MCESPNKWHTGPQSCTVTGPFQICIANPLWAAVWLKADLCGPQPPGRGVIEACLLFPLGLEGQPGLLKLLDMCVPEPCSPAPLSLTQNILVQ